MKKFILLPAFMLTSIGFAQLSYQSVLEQMDPLHQGVCGNNVEMEKAFSENPALKDQHEIDKANFEIEYQQFLQEYDPNARSTYTVPVVVHIIHENGAENISDAQVYDAISVLNEDFNMLSPDLSTVVTAFQGIIGNADVEFKLATKDPTGQCHLGITRTFMSGGGTHDTGDNSDVRSAVQNLHGTWPQNKYMNIFVVKSINGSAAYTNTPGNWYNPNGSGGSIYTGHSYFGSLGTSSNSTKHTLSHEVGHWLNLSHIWGSNNSAGDAGSCSTDDGVADTPNSIGGTCNYTIVTCSSLDNVQNMMDYTGSCAFMFTQGQAARMQTALNSSTAQRNNLWQTSNLISTGTLTAGTLCQVQFSSNVQTLCAGQTVDFTDESYSSVTSRTWTFDGGTPATSTSAQPTVTYSTPGTYSVTLQASDGTSTMSSTSTNYIVVLGDPGVAIPYSEGFEGITAIPNTDKWMVVNDNGNATWSWTNTAGSQGTTSSAKLGNYGNSDGTIDELVSGTIDLSSVAASDPMVFTFDFAYRRLSSADNEWLRFYISNDCGETWVLRKNFNGANLGTVNQTAAYTPVITDWVSASITNINSAYYVSNFRFKFQFENDGGNNIYIDNINLYPTSMTSIGDQDAFENVSVYPNPATESTMIQLNGEVGKDYTISVHSTLGQQLALVYQGQLTSGLNSFDYNTSDLAKGVYLIRIESEGRIQTIKLIKK
jgi:PKD repeat protein